MNAGNRSKSLVDKALLGCVAFRVSADLAYFYSAVTDRTGRTQPNGKVDDLNRLFMFVARPVRFVNRPPRDSVGV